MAHPTIHTVNSRLFTVHRVDAGKAPTHHTLFQEATSAEGMVKVVQGCIELQVPLLCGDGKWHIFNAQHVVDVACDPFD